MRRVIVESPLSGDFARNQRYARWCMLDCLKRGEAPFASHLLYTQCLDDRKPKQRELGIVAGFAWGEDAEHVFYVDLCPKLHVGCRFYRPDMSSGMQRAYDRFGGEVRRLPRSMWRKFRNGEEPKGT